MKPMFTVHRYIEIGHRGYRVGSKITDLDIESWQMAPADVTTALQTAVAKGMIEAIHDPAPAAAAPVTPAAAPVAPAVEKTETAIAIEKIAAAAPKPANPEEAG
jgi:hypothetical protein